MDQPIKITAEVDRSDIGTCRFTVDRRLFPGYVRFDSKEEAKGSPLAEGLLGIEGVVGATIAGNAVTVHKVGNEEWPLIGKKIGAVIRERIQSGQPLISDAFKLAPVAPAELKEKVQQLLDSQINPAVGMHGGFVEILDVMDNNVYLRMGGGCQGCGAADITLKQGIESLIRDQVPEVANIYDTTDHAAGTNPYYAPQK